MDQEDPDVFENLKADAVHMPEVAMRYLLMIGGSISGIFRVPAELVLRLHSGSRHVDPVETVVGYVVFGLATLIGSLFEAALRGSNGGPRLIGLQELFAAFHVLLIYRSWYVWRRMLRLDEVDSHAEGQALAIFRWLLPHSTWSTTRLVYEPVSIFIVVVVLHMAGLTEPTVLLYGIFVAQMLFLRNLTDWYQVWLTIREALDGASRSKMLMAIVKGQTSAQAINPRLAAHMSGSLPAETRVQIARIVTGLDSTAGDSKSKLTTVR